MHGRLKQSNEMQRSGKENNQGARLSRGKRTTRSIALHQILDMPSNQCIIQVIQLRHSNPLLVWVIKPLGEDSTLRNTPGTVKPFQVSLVEPVAYQFQLRTRARKCILSLNSTPCATSCRWLPGMR